jgi:hypothetical protein
MVTLASWARVLTWQQVAALFVNDHHYGAIPGSG